MLGSGKRVVLVGEYGTGKSRCIREIFFSMAALTSESQQYPVAIDLREAWGLKRGMEIVRRHIEDLGLDMHLQQAAVRATTSGSLTFLFDGFDELGSQAWSSDSEKLRAIRAKALEGVKDLVARSPAGVFISGREHYFNNNEEMFSALGLDPGKTILLRCKEEFSDEEVQAFFKRLNAEIVVLTWLPRRPLICQTIADLSAEDLDQMFGVGDDEIAFWDHFIYILCERDARIHVSFDAKTIQRVLTYLARVTRSRSANVGPITLADVQSAFEDVVGQMPVEEAAVMLQRLAALGRVKAESNDRQFIDMYILDGLRANDVADVVLNGGAVLNAYVQAVFINPLGDLGQRILARRILTKPKEFMKVAVECSLQGNKVLGCDIVASSLRLGQSEWDFNNLTIHDGNFLRLDMSVTIPIRLTIIRSIISTLVLPSAPPPQTTIVDCLSERVYGVSAASGLPDWITRLEADHFDSVESVSRIRRIGLDPRHEILATIVRKTFFQKGTGRKEEALLRGLGRIATAGVSDKIVNYLLKEGILTRFKGDEGWVYAPERKHAGRMKKMLYELKASQDPIWLEIGSI